MSSWCAWPHMRIETSSMSAGPRPARARSTAHANAAAISSGSVPSMVIPGMPYPAALSANTRAADWSPTGVESARLIVLDREDGRELAGRAQVDRLVPLAERRAAFADERDGDAPAAVAGEGESHPCDRERPDGKGRSGGQYPPRQIADVEIFPVHRRPGFGHLRRQHHLHGLGSRPHRQRRTEIADDRRDHVAPPRVSVAMRVAAAEPDARGVDGLLPKRSKPFALERRLAVADFPAGKERLEPVIDRPREHHAAQDLSSLVGRQRGTDGGAAEEAVAGVHELVGRQLESPGSVDSWGCFCALGRRQVPKPRPKRGFKGGAERGKRRLVRADGALAHVERGANGSDGKREALDDKRVQTPGEIRSWMNRRRGSHTLSPIPPQPER